MSDFGAPHVFFPPSFRGMPAATAEDLRRSESTQRRVPPEKKDPLPTPILRLDRAPRRSPSACAENGCQNQTRSGVGAPRVRRRRRCERTDRAARHEPQPHDRDVRPLPQEEHRCRLGCRGDDVREQQRPAGGTCLWESVQLDSRQGAAASRLAAPTNPLPAFLGRLHHRPNPRESISLYIKYRERSIIYIYICMCDRRLAPPHPPMQGLGWPTGGPPPPLRG